MTNNMALQKMLTETAHTEEKERKQKLTFGNRLNRGETREASTMPSAVSASPTLKRQGQEQTLRPKETANKTHSNLLIISL